jgi:hypothetical protein
MLSIFKKRNQPTDLEPKGFKSVYPKGRNVINTPVDYSTVLQRARGIQHTFGDNSLSKAIQYTLIHY